ncbi:hypothetical protein KC361_g257 [Hortaea werneckii]|nr:hypothetical protein KC361_g257 [Hortaea werneckii]
MLSTCEKKWHCEVMESVQQVFDVKHAFNMTASEKGGGAEGIRSASLLNPVGACVTPACRRDEGRVEGLVSLDGDGEAKALSRLAEKMCVAKEGSGLPHSDPLGRSFPGASFSFTRPPVRSRRASPRKRCRKRMPEASVGTMPLRLHMQALVAAPQMIERYTSPDPQVTGPRVQQFLKPLLKVSGCARRKRDEEVKFKVHVSWGFAKPEVLPIPTGLELGHDFSWWGRQQTTQQPPGNRSCVRESSMPK